MPPHSAGRRRRAPVPSVYLRHLIVLSALLTWDVSSATAQERPPAIRVEAGRFVDPAGRVVVLRGINLTGDAKVPPFGAKVSEADLDRIADLGMNVARLLFIWEAYEPTPGCYDEGYLAALNETARAAWARGIHVVIDIHQDGFSRHSSRGAGDGFPAWAVTERWHQRTPDNSARSKYWPVLMATDPTTHRSFGDFFADVRGVRTRFMTMLGRLAEVFSGTPGVIGYDLMNEPWGDEPTDLDALYRDAAGVIRAVHPTAVLFLEGQVSTNCGLQSRLPRPRFDGVAYAPHYYRPLSIVFHAWFGSSHGIDASFSNMRTKAAQWDAPLFLGEFGCDAGMIHAGDYVDALYDRLDSCLASGAQWNYTPGWTPETRDGWNGEDFNILAPDGTPRANFRPRPYPRATSGVPRRFEFHRCPAGGAEAAVSFAWDHVPELGETELFVPREFLSRGANLQVQPAGLSVRYDPQGQRLICRCPDRGPCEFRLSFPRP